jgi:Zincin-like metallopeptidase
VESACSRICQNSQVSPTRQFDETITPRWRLDRRPRWRVVCQPGIPHGVGKRQQIIGARPWLILDHESDYFPAARRRQRLGMRLAEVIAVWFNLICQRTQNRRGIPVGVGQRGGSRIRASRSRTSAQPHLPDGTPQAGSIVGSAAVSGYSADVHRRDRHGRGLRGPLALPNPLTTRRAQPAHPVNKADFFTEAVHDAVDRVGLQCPDVLVGITFGIEDVPQMVWSGDQVPLAAALEGTADQAAQVVIYRRPLEHRAVSRRGLRILVYRTIVEQLSALTGRSVDEIDPDGAGAEDD